MATIDIETLQINITSDVSSAIKGINSVQKALGKLKTASGTATTATNKTTKANKAASLSYVNLYAKVMMATQAVKAIGRSIASAIEESNDYVENLNLFTVSMGEYAGEAKEYAETVGELMGIDPSDWMRNQGIFMTLATGFGVANDRAKTMSKNLTQLGYDISSFFNISVGDSMQKLQSGLSGELEPLRRLGYDLSQAKLEATALELGITKNISAMTQAEKAELRYYAIMNQVTTAQGDMARTLNAPANQLRVLSAQATQCARAIGNIFIPALNAILPYANAVLQVIRALANIIANLFGFELPEVDYSGMTGMANGAEDTADALEDAGKAAKKLKDYTMGFDELNVINPNSGGSGTEDALGSGGFDFELPEYDFLAGLTESKVSTIVAEMKEWLGITDDIDTWAELFDTKLGKILLTVGLIGLGFAAWKISDAVVSNLGTIKSNLKKIAGLAAITIVVYGVLEAASWIIDNCDTTTEKIGGILGAASLALGAILAFTGVNIPLGIALMAVGAVSLASIIALNTNKLSDDMKQTIAIITDTVSTALIALGAVLAFSGVNIPLGLALIAGGAITLATAIAPNWDNLSKETQNTITFITGIVSAALLVLGAILLFTGAGIPLGLGLLVAGGVGLAASIAPHWDFLVEKVKEIWGKIKAFWDEHIAPIFTKEWWLNLAKTCGNGLMGGFEKAINGIIGMFENMINWVVRGLNKISFDIPEWVPLIGGKSFGINISEVQFKRVKLPTFAEGGFPETGELFVAREAGAEMVGSIGRRTAVANNDQIVAGIASGVAEANSEQNSLLREQNTLLRALLEKDTSTNIDGRRLSKELERVHRGMGATIITGGAY